MEGGNDFTFRIGIDSSDFDKGLKETQKKLSAAMAQFEREKSLVKIRADIDIAGLDATTDKTKILAIQEKALSDTLDLQRQKLQAASEAYELTANSQGQQAASSQKLELAMEKERLKVVQLEKELEKLKQSSDDIKISADIDFDVSKIDTPKIKVDAEVDTSQIKSGISKAEKSIKSELDKLQRQQTLIQLQGQVKLEGLDEAAGSTEKLKLQEEALTAQINVQKEKIALLSNAYGNLVQSQGENSDAAQIMALQLEKEQLAMLRLQQQTEDLSKQQEIAFGINWEMLSLIEPAIKGIDAMIAAGRTIPIPHAKIAAAAAVALSAIAVGTKEATDELRENNPAQILADEFNDIDISESFGGLAETATRTSREIEAAFSDSARNVSADLETMSSSYADYLDDALSIIQILVTETDNLGDSLGVVNSQLPYFKTETGRIAAIAIGLYKTFDELSKAALEWVEPAVDGFKEVRKQADELYLSLSKAQEIGSLIDLAGADYEDVRDYLRGAQDAVIKGDSTDPEVLAFEKNNVAIQDAKGHLLEFDEALENVYQGYLKAKEAGEAEAYIIMTNGQAVHDVATFFENYGKAKERNNQIKWSTSDFDSLAKLSQNLKMAEVQTNEFNNAISTLGVPFANLAAESNFEFFKMATELIEDNRDTILLWEFAAIEAFKSGKQAIIDFATSAIDKLQELNETFGITAKIQNLFSGIDDSLGITDKLGKIFSADDYDKKDSIFDKAKKDLDAYNAANAKSREETKKNKKDIEALSYSLNRIAQFKEEIADIKIELQFGDDEYAKQLAQLDQWREKALQDAKYYEEEQAVIAEEYGLKRELIEKKHNEEIAKARKESLERAKDMLKEAASLEFSATHSEFEKQLYDIEQWKQAQFEKAETAEEVAATIANAAMKEADAFEKEVDRIKGKIESAQDRLARLTLSQRDNDIYQAQKQYYQDLQDLPKEFADAIYKATIQDIQKRTKQDKSGSYTKRPNSSQDDGNYYQLLDFTKTNKQLEENAKHLIKLDAEQLAYIEALKKSGLGVSEVERSIGKVNISNFDFAKSTGNVSAELNQNFQDVGSTVTSFNDTIKNVTNNIDRNSGTIKNATSAAETFTKALEIDAQIRAQNQDIFSLPNFSAPESQKINIEYGDNPQQEFRGIEIIYGDVDDVDVDNLSDEIPVLYGKFAGLGNATDKLTADIGSVNFDSFVGVNNAALSATESLDKIKTDDVQKNLVALDTAATPLTDNFTKFDTALDTTTAALQQAADKINGLSFQQTQQAKSIQPQPTSSAGDTVDKALDATQTTGKIMGLIGSAMSAAPLFGGPAGLAIKGVIVALTGGLTEIVADIAQQVRNSSDNTSSTDSTVKLPTPDLDFSKLESSASQAAEALDKIPAAISQIESQPTESQSNPTFFEPLQANLENFNLAIQDAESAVVSFANILNNSVANFTNLENPTVSAQNSDLTVALQQLNQLQSQYLPQIEVALQPLQQMTQQLSELSQTAGTIAQYANQNRQPPNVNISPVNNINIKLGGAYVFDNQMKRQLTEDIKTDVANAITDAVQTAANNLDLGYGN